MCCEECQKYERCEENNRLKDNCCPTCEDYYDCVDLDDRDLKPDRDSSEYNSEEN